MFYLESSYVIRKVMNYRPSVRAVSRKLSRLYAYHPILTLPFNPKEEKYVENFVFSEIDAKHYWREDGREVDFLMDGVPVEVKFVDEVDERDVRWLRYYMESFGVDEEIVLTRNFRWEKNGLKFIPLWLFCLRR